VVLEAACEVFADRGHDAATVREIAGAAGVTVPVLYQHFESKSDLHVALLEQSGEQLIARVVSSPLEGTPEQFLRSTCEAFFGWVEEHPPQWRLLFRDAAADPVVAAAQTALFARARDEIARLFALTPAWALSTDVDQRRGREMLAQLTVFGLNGLAAWWWDNQDVPRAQVVGTAMDLLWSGISAIGRGGPFEAAEDA
jgi:AcrR family transcriptional regulator